MSSKPVNRKLGTAPIEISWLYINASGWLRQNFRRLKKMGGKPSGPQLELVFNLLIDRNTSVSLISMLLSTLQTCKV